jgi:hypothetical protein
MPLIIAPVELSDFDAIIAQADTYEPGDDLVAPPNPVAWPVTTRAEAQERLRLLMGRQRQRFLEDPTARFMKVVDLPGSPTTATSDDTVEAVSKFIPQGDIIAIARWHYFPTGYDFDSMSHWEVATLPPDQGEWPPNFSQPLHDFILLSRDRARASWIPAGQPAWVLMHLVTRSSQRGRGAAGMLIKWGIEQSEREGTPAYLEAGVQGKPIYEKYGFRQVGEGVKLDLSSVGKPGVVFEMANMVRQPKER